MKAQKQYWLKYTSNNLECLFKCGSISEMQNHVDLNNITDDQITEIVRWI